MRTLSHYNGPMKYDFGITIVYHCNIGSYFDLLSLNEETNKRDDGNEKTFKTSKL